MSSFTQNQRSVVQAIIEGSEAHTFYDDALQQALQANSRENFCHVHRNFLGGNNHCSSIDNSHKNYVIRRILSQRFNPDHENVPVVLHTTTFGVMQ